MNDRFEDEDRRNLVSTILQYQDLDSLLRLSVVLGNLELRGDGCSLFLRRGESKDLELRESTVLTSVLGKPLNLGLEEACENAETIRRLLERYGKKPEELNHTLSLSDVHEWDPELVRCIHGFGLTRWAVQFHCPLVIGQVGDDIRWSKVDPAPISSAEKTDVDDSEQKICELTRSELGSIAITPFSDRVPSSDQNEARNVADLPRGVFRVVRKKEDREGFNEADLDWLRWFTDNVSKCMTVAVSLAGLMDVGARLEIEDFGERLVQLLTRVFRARGCSIFLQLESPVDNVKTFQCIATTGLYYKDENPINKEDAKYEIDMGSQVTNALTGWVLRHGQPIALKTSHEFKPSDFKDLNREPGHGTYREMDAQSPEHWGGPLLISPLFLHQGREVVGAIRVVRPHEDGDKNSFQPHEELLFLDISRRLSMVLTNLNVRQVSEELIELYDKPKKMIERVPGEVCRLLGVDGCSIFLLKGARLTLAATRGLLKTLDDKAKYWYDIDDPKKRGWTGWVALHRKPLRFNDPEEAQRIGSADPPQHPDNKLERLCEIEVAYRFMAAPIFRSPKDPNSEVLGVIRAPRSKDDQKFDEVHQSILVSFAARLSLALNMARRSEAIEAVTELAKLEEEIDYTDKARLELVAQKVINVMSEKVGLTAASVYWYDEHTNFLVLLRGYPPTDTLPDRISWAKKINRYEYPVRSGNEIRLGKIFYDVNDDEEPSDRQHHLVSLLAGVCARAFLIQSTFQKLQSIRYGFAEIGAEVTSYSPLSQKLKTIADAAANVTSADYVIIHEYVEPAPGKNLLEGRFHESACGGQGEPEVWKGQGAVKNDRFTQDAVPYQVILHGKEIFEPEAKDSKILSPKEFRNRSTFIEREGIRSAAALRLDAVNTCFGCIFFNYKRKREFNERQIQEIRMMAEYGAAAIHQSRLLEETRRLAREKTDLLRYADHSLAQPLNALLGYLDNLVDGIHHRMLKPDNLVTKEAFRESEFTRKAEQYHKLCKYIVYLIDHFLRIDSSESVFKIKSKPDSDLSNVCREAVEVAEAYMRGTIGQHIDPSITGCFDQNAIRMVILNILINAVKYGRRHGVEPPIRLRLHADHGNGSSAMIQVDDSGPGIPESEKDSVFERGYKKHRESTGLGIGLFLARGYVEKHEGSIHVAKSDLGGASFRIELPLSQRGNN